MYFEELMMQQQHGNLKVNKLKLQGHGDYGAEDVLLEVKNNAFTISMGSNTLMTVSKYDSNIDNNFTITETNLCVSSNLYVGNSLHIGKYKFTEHNLKNLFNTLSNMSILTYEEFL